MNSSRLSMNENLDAPLNVDAHSPIVATSQRLPWSALTRARRAQISSSAERVDHGPTSNGNPRNAPQLSRDRSMRKTHRCNSIRRPLTCRLGRNIALASAVAITAAQTAEAADVGLWVLAPRPPESLNSVEEHGAQVPWFQKEFRIPYDIVEPFI